MTLFRPEVLEGKRLQRFGRAVPLYSANSLPITLVLLFGAIVLAVWLVTGSYARTQLAEGWVVPDGPMVSIEALQTGTLTSLEVREGDKVVAGQKIATVRLQGATTALADPAVQSLDILARQSGDIATQAVLARAASREDTTRLAASRQGMVARLTTIDRQISIQQERVTSAQRSFDIMVQAERARAINRIDFEGQRRALLAEKTQLEQLIADRALLKAQISDSDAEMRIAPIRLAQKLADLRAGGIEIEKQRLAVQQGSTLLLVAPFDGVVGVVNAKVGQTLGPRQPVVQVLGSSTRLEAEVYAPTRAIGFASLGQEVRLMLDAFPYEQYGTFAGTITEISRSAIAPQDVTAPVKPDGPSYRVRIRLNEQAVMAFGKSYPVQPGMTLRANIILERQNFLQWLLEPVNAIRKRMS